jgi:carboxylesterase
MENNTKEKAVLLIHGITGTPAEMNYISRAVNKAGYAVFCNTLPHHCGSLKELKKVTWQEIADFCGAQLHKLKKDYPKVFVGGISMGALMGIHLARKLPQEVSGIIAFSPTLDYDGWAIHKGQALMPLVWHIPFLRNAINIRESSPYGLKDEFLRENIRKFYSSAKVNDTSGRNVLFGSPFFPLSCLYQHSLFVKVVKKELPGFKHPIIIFHARQDDMTSLRNARYIFDHIGSPDKQLVILEDSYHMVIIDKEKEKVARGVIAFLERL